MLPVFIYPNPNLQCLVQAIVAMDHVVVRTFAVHAAAAVAARGQAWILSPTDIAAALAAPVPPVTVSRATAPGAYLRLRDLSGRQVAPAVPDDALLEEIGQTALVPDAALLGSGACSERAEWVVFADRDGQLHAPENRTLATYAARAPKTAIYGQKQRNSVLTVLMPFRDADFARAVINVKANPAYGILCDAASVYAVTADGMQVGGLPPRPADRPAFAWPGLSLDAPAQLPADGFAEVTVQLVDGGSKTPLPETGPQVYLESDAGYLPKRRITLTDGRAVLRIGALGLAPGDRLHLKAGWRYYPGLAEAEIVIV